MANQKRASIPAADDPIVTAVLYCVRLEYVDRFHPLWGTPYFGQTVRVGTPEEVAKTRWKEEVYLASKYSKQIGFLAALESFGEDAFSWTIVESREGPRSEVQAYADAAEVRLIADAGGPLQAMTQRLRQTFNQTKGGKGDNWWASIDAFRANCFDRFRSEMEVYVEEFNTSLVPHTYVNPLTKYTLGSHLTDFRMGHLWEGSPRQTEIIKWAENLPRWAWAARATEDFREGCAERGREQWENADYETRANWVASQTDARNTSEYLAAASKRMCEKWANADEETRANWVASQTAAHRTPEFREAASKRGRERWENADEETVSNWKASIKAAHNTPEYLEAASKAQSKKWANASEEARSEWKASLKAAHNTPEFLEAASKRGREQAANESNEKRTERLAKMSTTKRAKTEAKREARLALMTPEERKVEEKKIAKSVRAAANRKNDLQLLRMVMPNAQDRDISAARRDGTLARRARSGATQQKSHSKSSERFKTEVKQQVDEVKKNMKHRIDELVAGGMEYPAAVDKALSFVSVSVAKAQAAARAAAKAGAGSSSDPVDPVEVAPMSDGDSDSE